MLRAYPNQKLIKSQKVVGNRFLMVNQEEWIEASKDLNNAAFLLWLYLAQDMPGFTRALSRKDVMTKLDVSSSTYDRAVKELIDKKYLVKIADELWYYYPGRCKDEEDGVPKNE